MSAEPHVDRATEAARCAQINFENMAKMTPALRGHPMFCIAKSQLDDAVKLLEGDDTVEGYDG